MRIHTYWSSKSWSLGICALLLLGLFPASLFAAVLENPAVGSTRSGVDSVFGWKCTAGTITVRFDGGDPIPVVYGSTRGDTVGECQDDDNGYVLLWNWGLLTPGEHQIEVFDNETLFASATFTVVSTGVEFLSSDATCTVANFPEQGDVSTVNWTDASQSFQLSEVLQAGPDGALPVMGRWLVTEDFVSEDCNWNEGPAQRLGSDTFQLTQDGSALSGNVLDEADQPALGLSGFVEPDQDFQIVIDPAIGNLSDNCMLRQTAVFHGSFLTGDLAALLEFDLSGDCADMNDCAWSFSGTIGGPLDESTPQPAQQTSPPVERTSGYLTSVLHGPLSNASQ